MRRLHAVALLSMLAVPGCDSPVEQSRGLSHTLIRVTADDQVVATGEPIALEVRVVGERAAPVSGSTVAWTIDGAGSVTARSVTSAAGIASAELRPGPGENLITASVEGGGARTLFTIHGCPDCPSWQAITLPAGGRAWARRPRPGRQDLDPRRR